MPKRKEPELDPKEQFKRFREAAKAAEVDPDKAKIAFDQIARPIATKSNQSPKKD